MNDSTAARLRARVTDGPLLVLPGAGNALTARVIEELGFDAVYVTGAGVANSYLGAPDVGLVTLTELAGHVAAIRDAVRLPLVVDADTGFGNPVSVARTVTVLERSGADAIQLEDQVAPKKCGHFTGKQVIPAAEMVAKIHAAVDARTDDDVLLIARTDARSVEGFDAAVERARTYAAEGADVIFVEAPRTNDEVLALPGRVDAPQLVNFVYGGKTPMVPLSELKDFRIALFANAALQAAVKGMQRVLGALKETGGLDSVSDLMADFDVRQRVVDKPRWDALESKYATD